jgi:dienelactone hydrolase
MRRILVRTGRVGQTIAAVVVVLHARALAQESPFNYLRPDPGTIVVSRDVPYAAVDTVSLQMDVYRPAHADAPAPALIIFHVAVGDARRNAFSASWAQIAAARGLVAIVPDLRSDAARDDFQRLVDHLTTRAAEYGLDRDAIAVYAGSGNVSTALPLLQDPRQTRVKAAVIYYGVAPVERFRLDLPVLYARAGLDRPEVNAEIDALVARGIAENAPITLMNLPGSYHAFETRNDDAARRAAIDRTLDFVVAATNRGIRLICGAECVKPGPRAMSLAAASRRRQRSTGSSSPSSRRTRPCGSRMAKRCSARRGSPTRARNSSSSRAAASARDLGLPAARACLRKGDPDAATAWLRTIPPRFLPPTVRTDRAFATLQHRADFQALFAPRH